MTEQPVFQPTAGELGTNEARAPSGLAPAAHRDTAHGGERSKTIQGVVVRRKIWLDRFVEIGTYRPRD
jgi:hypothetical protein